MTLTYQRFTAVLLLIYDSLFLSGIYYCLVPSGEGRLRAAFLMQCPTRCHDPRTVLMKVQL